MFKSSEKFRAYCSCGKRLYDFNKDFKVISGENRKCEKCNKAFCFNCLKKDDVCRNCSDTSKAKPEK